MNDYVFPFLLAVIPTVIETADHLITPEAR